MSQLRSFLLHDFMESDFHGMQDKDSRYLISFQEFSNAIEQALDNKYLFDRISSSKTIENIHLTFDDGGKSALILADFLYKKGIRATFFIVTNFIGRSGFLNPEEIRYIASMGHFIGSHSHSHLSPFCEFPYDILAFDIFRSIDLLENILNEKIYSFAVPGGEVRSSTLDFLSNPSFGFQYVFTSLPAKGVYKKIKQTSFIGRLCIERNMSSKDIVQYFSGQKWRINRFNYQIRRAKREVSYFLNY